MLDRPISVLFVDPDPAAGTALRNHLHEVASGWDVRIATSGDQALKLLHEVSFDVVVSEMGLDGLSGAELLGCIRLRWPNTIRLMCSSETDQAELLNGVASIHQFLQKPCDPAALFWAMERSIDLAQCLEDVGLQKIVNRIESLPVLSSTYTELARVLADPDCEIDTVAAIAEADIGLTTKCLQMVNSAFFGLSRRISKVRDAIALIGLQRLRVLALTSRVVDAVAADDSEQERIARLWKASVDMGAAAAQAARHQKEAREVCEDARLAGTLALIGRALLIRFLPEQHAEARRVATANGISLSEAEAEVFGVPQHYVGAYALGIWAFDDSVVEAVANQMARPENTGLTRFVHLARTLDYGDELVDIFTPDEAEVAAGERILALR